MRRRDAFHPSKVGRYRCCCSYDGSEFSGWHTQKHGNTVQNTIERALISAFGGIAIKVIGSGRTDAGVHARKQVFHFDAPLVADGACTADFITKLQRRLNIVLPDAIVIRRVRIVPRESFHARKSVVLKRYVYAVDLIDYNDVDAFSCPFESRRRTKVRLRKDVNMPSFVERLTSVLALFRGHHNFSAFCIMEKDDSRPVTRHLSRSELLSLSKSSYELIFECDFFLYKMVRRIVGTALEVAHGRLSMDIVRTLLQGPDAFRSSKVWRSSKAKVPTAPPHGLRMDEVVYE